MSSRWPSSRLLGITAAPAAAAAAAVLAGCGSIQAPGATGGVGGTSASSATAGPPASASASASGRADPTCEASGLKVRLNAAAAGVAAGTSYVPLEFTNTSGQSCLLAGYPAVALTSGASGHQIGAQAAIDRGTASTAVLLAPGATAHAWLQVASAGNIPASKCHPVTAAGLRVVAPGNENASYLPHRVAACKTTTASSQILTVHPVQPGKARRGTA
jgi:hypothetical protein